MAIKANVNPIILSLSKTRTPFNSYSIVGLKGLPIRLSAGLAMT
jgi:cell division protein YceG involved in septum cleavage